MRAAVQRWKKLLIFLYSYMISKLIGSAMGFVAKHTGNGSERVGTLSGFTRLPGTIIETPTAALLTRVISLDLIKTMHIVYLHFQ